MTERGTRYLELLNEMEWHRAISKLTREAELKFAAQLDRLWVELDEQEQSVIEAELESIDVARSSEGSLCNDTSEGSAEPREAAA